MSVNVSTSIDECKPKVSKVPGVAVDVISIETCCPPLLGPPLDEQGATELAAAFKVLADPVRLRLLSLIASAPDGCACSCDLEEPVGKSQPTVSHHLSLLAAAGLITKEKQGRWVYCTVVPERLGALRDALGPSS